MSSQNLLLSLHAALDDLSELVERAERDLDPNTYRSVAYAAARLVDSLKESVQRGQRLVHHYEEARRLLAPRPSAHATVLSLCEARQRRQR